jgi:UDP-glucose:(heptosyl)LPS alpha-1,3-glucosyltransferase
VNITLIRRRFTPVGGGELYLQRLIDSLLAENHTIELVSEAWNARESEGIRYHFIPGATSRARRAVSFAEGVAQLLPTLKTNCVFSLERTFKQDVYRAGDGVHRVWLERQRSFAPFWKKPFCGKGAHHRNLLALEQRTLHPENTKFVIANSAMVRDEIVGLFGFPADRVRVIPNGVNLQRFGTPDCQSARSTFGLAPSDFTLLFVGSGWERKGLKYTIQLFQDLQSSISRFPRTFRAVKLLVVGKGPPPLRSNPDIIYTGPLSAVESAYAAANLLAFLPIYEPAANVVTEALAARLPVLTSAQNGAAEWIEGGRNGEVVDSPKNRGAILEAALRLMHLDRPSTPGDLLSMDRNVADTVSLIQQI